MVFLWFSIWFSIKPPFSYGFPMVLYHSALLRLARGTRRQRRRPQTTTAASSTRSVASAADSNSAPWRWFKQPGLINNGEEHEHYMSNRKNPGNTKYVFDGHWFLGIDGNC